MDWARGGLGVLRYPPLLLVPLFLLLSLLCIWGKEMMRNGMENAEFRQKALLTQLCLKLK